MTNVLISTALHTFLTAQFGGAARRFFRLDGFDDAVYVALLTRLRADGNMLGRQPLRVRTTAPLPGHQAYALEADESATWYRSHVPPGHVLVLIFSQPASDAQSLKESILSQRACWPPKGWSTSSARSWPTSPRQNRRRCWVSSFPTWPGPPLGSRSPDRTGHLA